MSATTTYRDSMDEDENYAAEADAIAKDAASLGMKETMSVDIFIVLEVEKDFMDGGMGETLSPMRKELLARARAHLGIREKEEPRRTRPSELTKLFVVMASGAAENTRRRLLAEKLSHAPGESAMSLRPYGETMNAGMRHVAAHMPREFTPDYMQKTSCVIHCERCEGCGIFENAEELYRCPDCNGHGTNNTA